MPRRTGRRSALHRAGKALWLGLEARRSEIEQAILVRVYGIADPTEIDDLAYVEGLRAAAAAALDWALATLESTDDRRHPLPPVLLSQARLAARNGVRLDTVLRRYTAGHALLVDFLIEEVEREEDLPSSELRRLLAASSSAFDRLLAAVSEEYARELESRPDFSQERRRAERVERLLAGEPTDLSALPYDFGGWHLGLVVQGSGAKQQIQAISATFDCRTLVVAQDEEVVWAWLGSREALDPTEVLSSAQRHRDLAIAVGEPAGELPGWRLTHRQAVAAFSMTRPGTTAAVRYADVALLISAKADEVLSTSLRMLFLAPLDDELDKGGVERETLRAYFHAECNVSSAAAILGVKRHTVTKRLRSIEERLGSPLARFSAEIDVALRLEEWESPQA